MRRIRKWPLLGAVLPVRFGVVSGLGQMDVAFVNPGQPGQRNVMMMVGVQRRIVLRQLDLVRPFHAVDDADMHSGGILHFHMLFDLGYSDHQKLLERRLFENRRPAQTPIFSSVMMAFRLRHAEGQRFGIGIERKLEIGRKFMGLARRG